MKFIVQKYLAVAGATFVALGLIPTSFMGTSLPKATWLEWSMAVLPALPLIVLVISIVSHRKIPIKLAAALTILFTGAGTLLTVSLAALSGGGSTIVLLHGAALTIACATCFLLISPIGQIAGSVVFSIFLLPVFVGAWSLAMVPLSYTSAVELSSNQAYCIGGHNLKEAEISSLLELRGLSFYTTRSGYKVGDTWFFHGLLLVEDDDGLKVYNWSPRHMAFQLVERPQSLLASPLNACQPRHKFLPKTKLI